jgi:hypothetical protein
MMSRTPTIKNYPMKIQKFKNIINNKEKEVMEKKESKPTEKLAIRNFKDKIVDILQNNKVSSVLALLLLIVFVWLFVKIRINERNFQNEKTELINQHSIFIDSLQINHLEFATEVFSWSVRTELIRNNTENINQLLTIFVKESGADLVQLIDPEGNTILLSSDKKFEGKEYSGGLNFELNSTIVLKTGKDLKIITPVMGFNSKIGILIVQLTRK